MSLAMTRAPAVAPPMLGTRLGRASNDHCNVTRQAIRCLGVREIPPLRRHGVDDEVRESFVERRTRLCTAHTRERAPHASDVRDDRGDGAAAAGRRRGPPDAGRQRAHEILGHAAAARERLEQFLFDVQRPAPRHGYRS